MRTKKQHICAKIFPPKSNAQNTAHQQLYHIKHNGHTPRLKPPRKQPSRCDHFNIDAFGPLSLTAPAPGRRTFAIRIACAHTFSTPPERGPHHMRLSPLADVNRHRAHFKSGESYAHTRGTHAHGGHPRRPRSDCVRIL